MDKSKRKQELKDLRLILTNREEYKREILERYGDSIDGIEDFLGDGYDDMSNLFYFVNRRYLHWLSTDPDESVIEKEILFRRKFYKILKAIGPKMLGCTQVYENRNKINDPNSNEPDNGIVLPDKPVIFVGNHGFRDDVLATVLAANRHGYIYWGSIPQFFNTIDGLSASLVGEIIFNRKNKTSKKESLKKVEKVMDFGTDIVLFPEGGWNKTSELLVTDLWKGVYVFSKLTGAYVVPITHYVRDMEIVDKKNIIHTIVDDPIPMFEMTQEEALMTLRDNFASWTYKMAEVYGKSTRDEELEGFKTSDEKWNYCLQKRMEGVDRYDSSIEKCSDYRPKEKVRIEDVFEPIANIQNITSENIRMVEDAKKLVKEKKQTDFQRLY